MVLLDVLEHEGIEGYLEYRLNKITNIAKISSCSSAGRLFTQVLQPSSVSGTFVLQFVKKRKGLRVSGSEYKQGFLKFLSNALGGVRKGMCKF